MSIPTLQLDAKSFDQLRSLVHQIMGITIKPGRHAMIEGRLRKRLRALDMGSYEEYIRRVKSNAEEQQAFIDAITTNETYFYRTPRIWNYLYDNYLKELPVTQEKFTLKVWSAASSTGEEAYTLGIFLEHFKRANPKFDYHIDGTDISSQVLSKARNGVYAGRSIERFRTACPELFEKYMVGSEESGYSVLPGIRRKVRFFPYNLFDEPRTSSHYHLILLRNVLIYFVKTDQCRVMENIFYQLKDSGTVIIGESESLNGIDTPLRSVSPTIYQHPQNIQTGKAA